VLNWLKKNKTVAAPPLRVDIHSHLLPGLDDGVKTFDDAVRIITRFQELGYTRLITTPHIISDIYRNTPDSIREKHEELVSILEQKQIDVRIDAAAEYYLDESLLERIESNEKLLTIGDKFLLFETNFLTEPLNLKQFIFLASTKGYKLILAHPERYLYLNNNMEKAADLIDRGVLFQINMNSLTGYYSKQAQAMAAKLIDRGWVHFLGSDCHHYAHIEQLKEIGRNKNFQKALNLPLLNNSIP
jgi:protein-tyrosine phosphatase